MVAEDAQAAGSAKGGKSKKPLIIILVVAVIVLAGGGFGVWKFVLSDSKAESSEHAEEESHGAEDVPALLHSLEPFIVNLFDREGMRYLKVKIEMELKGIVEEELKPKVPKIRDSLIILLSSKKYHEIGSIEGKMRLREEIAYRINAILGEGAVQDIYFTDFVVQ